MTQPNNEEFWQQCERLWAAWLSLNGWTVTPLTSYSNNMAGTNAPMMLLPGTHGTAIMPDFLAFKNGQSSYWEIKSRRISHRNQLTGTAFHTMNLRNFSAHLRVFEQTKFPVYIVVYEYASAITNGRWLMIPISDIKKHGVVIQINDKNGNPHHVIRWPAHVMRLQAGPALPVEPSPQRYQAINHGFIPKPKKPRSPTPQANADPEYEDNLSSRDNAAIQYQRLIHRLELPHVPRYSVLRIGTQQVADVLQLLDYGIRVFLITHQNPFQDGVPTHLIAFQEARLLEWSIVPSLNETQEHWQIDGCATTPPPDWVRAVLTQADQLGRINMRQYDIVHAPFDSDVLVTAGAGTGKTETMSERLLFLLATASLHTMDSVPLQLNLGDISLITFTRDAAREMRARISRTILMRQRLARRCVLPTVAWIMQLGRAKITTIHAFAKAIIQQRSGLIDIQPDFRVTTSTFKRRSFIKEALSDHIIPLYEAESDETPALHFWVRHIEQIWESLENNGVPFMSIRADVTPDQQTTPDHNDAVNTLQWMDEHLIPADYTVAAITREVILSASQRYALHCVDIGAVPTNQLVHSAITILNEISTNPTIDDKRLPNPIRFLFVDEFQDTDALQMELILRLRQHYGTKLFMVGDAKQGIYRFRGAQGNSFDMLGAQMQQRNLPACAQYSMTRNFRSDGVLLAAMEPFFSVWGERSLLPYTRTDRLLPRWDVSTIGQPIQFETLAVAEYYPQHSAGIVAEWRANNPDASIAILTRNNYAALEIQKAIRSDGGQCDVLIGGSFYQCPAVREFRVLLEALLFPDDDAAILELCETRWGGKFILATEPPVLVTDNPTAWTTPIDTLLDWHTRLSSVQRDSVFYRADIERIRQRVRSFAGLLRTMATISFVVACRASLTPESCVLPDPHEESERARYERCLTHLITILDDNYADTAVTPIALLRWIRLQIATNHTEDEPSDERPTAGRTLALTVHKSKGLEFDFVLIPQTWNTFDHQASSGTECAVVEYNGQRRILWRWKRKDAAVVTNTSSQDASAWEINRTEIHQEETRLLYVAMTRAKHHLHILLRSTPRPDSWGALLAKDGRHAN